MSQDPCDMNRARLNMNRALLNMNRALLKDTGFEGTAPDFAVPIKLMSQDPCFIATAKSGAVPSNCPRSNSQKSPTQVERAKHITREPYICQKSPIQVQRAL